ncbi:hypothetical protein NE237_020800 [Protea cynaroides]|uniref:Uncharacterized protein n=1 Tax=Protea cynaroides TaxID=273540 RepID=A0A9Q0K3S4_9MAGN|nr:hypothetical protein NE237_020800 [Protea cynaroides]
MVLNILVNLSFHVRPFKKVGNQAADLGFFPGFLNKDTRAPMATNDLRKEGFSGLLEAAEDDVTTREAINQSMNVWGVSVSRMLQRAMAAGSLVEDDDDTGVLGVIDRCLHLCGDGSILTQGILGVENLHLRRIFVAMAVCASSIHGSAASNQGASDSRVPHEDEDGVPHLEGNQREDLDCFLGFLNMETSDHTCGGDLDCSTGLAGIVAAGSLHISLGSSVSPSEFVNATVYSNDDKSATTTPMEEAKYQLLVLPLITWEWTEEARRKKLENNNSNPKRNCFRSPLRIGE